MPNISKRNHCEYSSDLLVVFYKYGIKLARNLVRCGTCKQEMYNFEVKWVVGAFSTEAGVFRETQTKSVKDLAQRSFKQKLIFMRRADKKHLLSHKYLH